MAIITFTSDFGAEDHYVAAVKAGIVKINPGLHVIDISHHIHPFDIAHGAYVIKSVYRDFPEGTVHLVAVNTVFNPDPRYIAIQLDDQYFIGPDNGILNLISDKEPSRIVEIDRAGFEATTFPARDILGKAAAMLAGGTEMPSLGRLAEDHVRLLARQLKATKKLIAGNVIRVDHYGNLITNIEKEIFRILHQGRPFIVKFGKEVSTRIHAYYTSVEPGECFILFNNLGLMEIGINMGNAAELLGLGYDSPVMIQFED